MVRLPICITLFVEFLYSRVKITYGCRPLIYVAIYDYINQSPQNAPITIMLIGIASITIIIDVVVRKNPERMQPNRNSRME